MALRKCDVCGAMVDDAVEGIFVEGENFLYDDGRVYHAWDDDDDDDDDDEEQE